METWKNKNKKNMEQQKKHLKKSTSVPGTVALLQFRLQTT